MKTHRTWRWVWPALLLLLLLAAACSPKIVKETVVVEKEKIVEKPVEKVVKEVVKEVAKGAAPAAAPAEAPKAAAAAPASDSSRPGAAQASAGSAVLAYQVGRMIIKNGEMSLLVADTDQAIDQITVIAVESGGYLISSDVVLREEFKYATLSLGVPVEQFEEVQRRVRAIALRVQKESASGKDVSDEYVDLQSRVTNLEATAARIRDFLKQANTVEESLKVNTQLSDIEDQIEQVKGRMNYLKDRAAYSTLTLTLEPQRPTPTTTPTPTVTPTPTLTPTPTREVWKPGETYSEASRTLGRAGRGVGDMVIWFVVTWLPFLIVPAAIIYWVVRRQRNRRQTPTRPAAPPPAQPPASSGDTGTLPG
jgi:hypothetical protein